MSTSAMNETKNILVVEDHPLFRAMLVQLINTEIGITVCCEADNIRDAMMLVERNPPDAAIVDLTLQGKSGLDLIKQLKSSGQPIPVLVISMHEEILYAERALRAGARGYISKQQPAAEVIKAIRKVLDGHIYVSECVSGAILEKLSDRGQHFQLSGIDALSDREIEVFLLIGRGLNSRQIGEQLNLVTSTVDSYRARIKIKLGIKNASELNQRATEWLVERSH